MFRKPLIPFGFWPGHWGLKGKTRDIARAEYELSGIELSEKLLEINYSDDPTQLEIKKLELRRKFNEIPLHSYDVGIAKLTIQDEKQRQLAILDADLKYEKITQNDYDRKKADILEEPWVAMPKIHWNPYGKARAYFEMNYNEYFIKQLKENGYEGTEQDMVNQWMNDVCIGILEEINGMEAEYATPSHRISQEHEDNE
jgi:hypothetical protein